MTEIPRASASAVAIIETPNSFIAEGRPDIPGQLANSGKVGLLGGHIEPDQTPYDAIRSELDQELGFRLIGPLKLVEDSDVESQNRHGETALRHVSLFHVAVSSVAELSMQLPETTIVEIPKTILGVNSHKHRVTPYTFRVLHRAVTGELPK